jgi:hypothetical protein
MPDRTGGEGEHRLRDVLGLDIDVERRALA